MEKNDPMNMFRSAKPMKIEQPKERQHKEADLHLLFCKWVKAQYPKDQFIRHEREGKRSFFMQNLFKVYNSDLDKMPDFECLETVHWYEEVEGDMAGTTVWQWHVWCRLYIEFKKPGTKLTLRDNVTIKPEYSEQYKRHVRFWEQNSPAYFCDNFDEAVELYNAYKSGKPKPMQQFLSPPPF